MRKIFYIAYNNLLNFILRNKFIFTMFLLGCIICSLLFMFFWGNIRYAVQSAFTSNYEVSLSEYTTVPIDELISLIDKYNVKADFISNISVASIENNLGDEYNSEYYISHKEGGISFLCSNNMDKFYMWGCEYTDLSTDNTIIIPESLTSGKSSPKTLNIEDAEMNVIGQTASKFFLVSNDTFKKLNLIPTTINITTDISLSDKARNNFLNEFNSLTNSSYTVKETNERFSIDAIMKTMAPSILVYLLCMSSMLYILTYMFETSAGEFSVYMMTGAEEKTIIKVNLGIQLIILLFSSTLAVIFHKLFYGTIFVKINYYTFNYTPSIYIESIILTTVLCLFIMNKYMKYKFDDNIVGALKRTDN